MRDGIGDVQYEANDMVDRLSWRHPMMKLLLASPAVQRDTKAARAVVDVLERRPPARMRAFRAAPSARSPLKAGRTRGPKARTKLRLSVPRI